MLAVDQSGELDPSLISHAKEGGLAKVTFNYYSDSDQYNPIGQPKAIRRFQWFYTHTL